MIDNIIIVFAAVLLAVFLFAIVTISKAHKEKQRERERREQNPFAYPYKNIFLNITRKRNPLMEDQIDRFLMDQQNWESIVQHLKVVEHWKKECKCIIDAEDSEYVQLRKQQYELTCDDANEFVFYMVRYRQTGESVDERYSTSYKCLEARHELLRRTGYSVTISEYQQKEQRSLMTPKLRKEIIERDKYTCQNCGKYMPDGIGIHVDHIIPVSRGGKTIPSNLQVLCAKCNTAKGARTTDEAADVLKKIADSREARITLSSNASSQLVDVFGGEREATEAVNIFAKQCAIYGRLPFNILDKALLESLNENDSQNDYSTEPLNRVHPYKRAEVDTLISTAPRNVKQVRIAGSVLGYSCKQNDPLIVVAITDMNYTEACDKPSVIIDDSVARNTPSTCGQYLVRQWLDDVQTEYGELKCITIDSNDWEKNKQKYEKIRNKTLRIK